MAKKESGDILNGVHNKHLGTNNWQLYFKLKKSLFRQEIEIFIKNFQLIIQQKIQNVEKQNPIAQ